MKIMKTEATIEQERRNRLIKKIENAGYYVYKDGYFCEYVIKKQKGFFKPKLVINIYEGHTKLTEAIWMKGKKEKEFIKEFEEKTGIELVRYI